MAWGVSARRSYAKRLIGTAPRAPCPIFLFFLSLPIPTLRSVADASGPVASHANPRCLWRDNEIRRRWWDIRSIDKGQSNARERKTVQSPVRSTLEHARAHEESITHPGFFELIEGLLLLFASQAFLLLVQREIRARLRVVRVRRALEPDRSSIRFKRGKFYSLTHASKKFQGIEKHLPITRVY